MLDDGHLAPDSAPAANEGFMQGGDLTLRTTDGVDFSVHSLFLSVASPVFSDLIKSGNHEEVVLFSENAELLAIMLRFIYPRPTPTITSIKLLNDALRVANKYQLDNMKSRLCEQLILINSPVSVYTDPLGALYVASTHGFTTGVELASSVASKQYNFGTAEGLKKLIDASPNLTTATLLNLVGIPLVKTTVLAEVLFQFNRSPMIITTDHGSMMCPLCREIFDNSLCRCQPEWQTRWVSWVFDNIKNRPVSDWKDFFGPSNIHKAFYQPHLNSTVQYYRKGSYAGACSCTNLLLGAPHAAFQSWADGVYEELKSRLGFIMDLEAKSLKPGPEGKKE
ncbi:unnamed protein product [Rhizoctonia solani]|uniref:BTB domain-containing protein n=1 Tax=Rhizoctonia solani TaxID=456999 RepID=A0A8H3GTU5_9AGAM|nr:unnamed protein product [Rhizoctonia solani]